MRRRVLAGCLLTVGGLLLAACGSSPARESSAARSALRTDVARIAQAASTHNIKATRQALGRLRSDVALYESHGTLPRTAGNRILAAAKGVNSRLELLVTTTTSSSTTTTSSPPTTTKPAQKPKPKPKPKPGPPKGPPPGHGDGHGHGNGNGNGNDG